MVAAEPSAAPAAAPAAAAPAGAPPEDPAKTGAVHIHPALLPAVEEAHTGEYNGQGATAFRNGNTYRGEFKERMMSGRGEYDWQQARVLYEGQFFENRLIGEGKYTWPDGSVYQGQVRNGLRHGYGVFTGPNAMCTYAGEWRDGHRHGRGRLDYDPQGRSYYDGEWQMDEKHGQGKMVYKSGNVYVGEWAHNVKCGYGEMAWSSSGEVYRGGWQDGLQHGHGEHEWRRSQTETAPLQLRERYSGQWREGKRHGLGIFIYANGSAYRGEWVANLKHGAGAYFKEDGSVYEGQFVNDRMDPGAPASATTPAPSDPYAELAIGELLVGEKDAELALRGVAHTLTRFNSELKRTYRFYAALHSSPEDAFTMSTAQLDTLLHDTFLAGVDFTLVDAHRVFFGARLRKGFGHGHPAAPPKPSVQQLVSETAAMPAGAPAAAPSAHTLPPPGAVHDAERAVLLREFSEGLVRLAHAKFPLLQSLPQRVHELLTSHVLANERTAAEMAVEARVRSAALDVDAQAVRACARALAPKLRPIFEAYAVPFAEEMPVHRVVEGDDTMRCREFALLLKNCRLMAAHTDVSRVLTVTALSRYDLPFGDDQPASSDARPHQHSGPRPSSPDDEAELRARLVELEITYDEFWRGLCLLAARRHANPTEFEPPPAAAPAGADDAAATNAEGGAEDGAGAAAGAEPAPPALAEDAPLDQIFAHFVEHTLLPRYADHRLRVQLAAMEI